MVATFRNRSNETLKVATDVGVRDVAPDATFDLVDDYCADDCPSSEDLGRPHLLAAHYELNDNFVLVAAAPAEPAPADVPAE